LLSEEHTEQQLRCGGFVINVSVMYPNQPGAHFDMSYYCTKHVPMVSKLLGQALLKVVVEEGLSGMAPGSPCAYLALGHLYFESVGAFHEAFLPHAAQIVGDVPNYTNTEPVIQISTVKM
jgi:uncharacterized protein (TIGR02118 family)